MAAFKQLIASEAWAFKKNNEKSIQSKRVQVSLLSWLLLDSSNVQFGIGWRVGRSVSEKQTQIMYKSRFMSMVLFPEVTV
jgi:hypothetical protein